MTQVAWVKVRGSDGLKLAGKGPVGPGPYRTGAGTFEIPCGVPFVVAAATHETTPGAIPEIPNAYISGSSCVVQTINRVGSLSDLDFEVTLYAP